MVPDTRVLPTWQEDPRFPWGSTSEFIGFDYLE